MGSMIAVFSTEFLHLPVDHIPHIVVELNNIKINVIKDIVDEFFVSLGYPVEHQLQTLEEWNYFIRQQVFELLLSFYVRSPHRFHGFMIVLILDTLFDCFAQIS